MCTTGTIDTLNSIADCISDTFSTLAKVTFPIEGFDVISFERREWSTKDQRTLEQLIKARGRKTSGTHYFISAHSGVQYGKPYTAHTLLVCVYLLPLTDKQKKQYNDQYTPDWKR